MKIIKTDKEKLLEKLYDLKALGEEAAEFKLKDKVIEEFIWEDEDNNIYSEDIEILSFAIDIDDAISIVKDKKKWIETTKWEGEVKKVYTYEGEPYIPNYPENMAIGGYGTNGVSERGAINIDEYMILQTKEIKIL